MAGRLRATALLRTAAVVSAARLRTPAARLRTAAVISARRLRTPAARRGTYVKIKSQNLKIKSKSKNFERLVLGWLVGW